MNELGSNVEMTSVDPNLFDYFFDPSALEFITTDQLPAWYQANVSSDLITGRTMMDPNVKMEPSPSETCSEASSPEPVNYLDLQQANIQTTNLFAQDTESQFTDDQTQSMSPEDEPDLRSSGQPQKSSKPRSKKRKIDDSDGSMKTLSSTEDLENYSKTIQSQRPLSQDEEVAIKRQRRLIKNRESAQKSRLRKKKYVEELEKKVKLLTDDNVRLDSENKALREDVGYLSTIVRKTPNIPNDVLRGVARKSAYSTASAKAAGVCLLIVLFSFGLFFNNKTGTRGLALPFEVSNPIEASGAGGENPARSRGSAGRLLRSIRGSVPSGNTAGEEMENIAEGAASLEQYFALQAQSANPHKRKRENEEEASETDSFQVKKHVKQPLKKIKIEKESDEDHSLVPLSESSPVPSSDQEMSSPGQSQSYIFCSDARELFAENDHQGTPRMISFLMPTDANSFFNPQMNNNAQQQSLLEVACSVVNMNVYSSPSGIETPVSGGNVFGNMGVNIDFGNKDLVS